MRERIERVFVFMAACAPWPGQGRFRGAGIARAITLAADCTSKPGQGQPLGAGIKKAIFLLAALVLVQAAASAPAAFAQVSPAVSLAHWEGKYPFGMPGQYKPFFDEPAVKAAMAKTAPPALMKKLMNWTLNVPFKREGDILYAWCMKPHSGGDYAAQIFFDLKSNTVQLCVTELDKKQNKKNCTWYGNTVRPLEEGACGMDDLESFKRYGDK